ncbi:hypothetical protein AcW2_005430 [Taiwanofungus camphoratus]|nr:hypothetical protein AcW2_005430 [Antrodia cinnamomea]
MLAMASGSRTSQISLIPVDPSNVLASVSNEQANSPRAPIVTTSDDSQGASQEQSTIAFVKGTKRKRLSKACDACHKSKRRCDGTAPCSNCYFASKKCTYTDSSGRPVPAPRNLNQDKSLGPMTDFPTNDHAPQQSESSHTARHTDSKDNNESVKKRSRSDRPSHSPTNTIAPLSNVPPVPPAASHGNFLRSDLLEPETTHELVNLFFAHCNPARMIFHKPSFFAALSHNRLPEYLVLAVCAVAAPLSKTVSAYAHPGRIAGVPFFKEALALIFDNAGRLLIEPNLATAQALCLLEMHEVAASHSWTQHYRYFDIAMTILENDLEVHKPDDRLHRNSASLDYHDTYVERECTRRCFWFIQCMSWINGIYTYKPMRPRSVELMPYVRLPIDETNFELTVYSNSATSEYLHLPAPRTRYASQFGHVCRILSVYATVQSTLAMKDGPARDAAVADSARDLAAWVESLPAHLRFTEENTEKQTVMFETGSNSGAWCYCFVHALHPCCSLALLEAEGRLGEPIPWVRAQLNAVFNAVGTRAKNTILSACVLWSYSKYHPDDPQLHIWDRDFEKVWAFRVTVVADQWRRAQALEQAKAAGLPPATENPQHREPAVVAPNTASSLLTTPHGRSPEDPGLQYYADVLAHRLEGPAKGQHQRLVHNTEPDHLVQAPMSRSHRDAVLPSLKASGLLDSWKPPSEAFANALSISSSQSLRDEERRSATTLLHPPAQPSRGSVTTSPTMPVGLNWLGDKS